MAEDKKQKVCPVLAQGWLANRYASDGDHTFNFINMPKCFEEDCAFWGYRQDLLSGKPIGYCKYTSKLI